MAEIEDSFISFKWNNHKLTFFNILADLRTKETYSDAFLACDGKFFPVHKLVLSTCSNYFSEVFEKINCKNPVVILKDIKQRNLESLLDYMYLGEVDVKENELTELLQAADCLCIKGLAIPDDISKLPSAIKDDPDVIDQDRTIHTNIHPIPYQNLREPPNLIDARSLLQPVRPVYSILSAKQDAEVMGNKSETVSMSDKPPPKLKLKRVCSKKNLKPVKKVRKSSRNPVLTKKAINPTQAIYFKHNEGNEIEQEQNKNIQMEKLCPKYVERTLDTENLSNKGIDPSKEIKMSVESIKKNIRLSKSFSDEDELPLSLCGANSRSQEIVKSKDQTLKFAEAKLDSTSEIEKSSKILIKSESCNIPKNEKPAERIKRKLEFITDSTSEEELSRISIKNKTESSKPSEEEKFYVQCSKGSRPDFQTITTEGNESETLIKKTLRSELIAKKRKLSTCSQNASNSMKAAIKTKPESAECNLSVESGDAPFKDDSSGELSSDLPKLNKTLLSTSSTSEDETYDVTKKKSSDSYSQEEKDELNSESLQSKCSTETAGPSKNYTSKIKKMQQKQEADSLEVEEFCNAIGLPVFSEAALPYLEGHNLSEKEVPKISRGIVDELVHHLNEHKMFIKMKEISMRSLFYNRLQLKLLEKYPRIIREGSICKKTRKGPLGFLITKIARKLNIQYRNIRKKLENASLAMNYPSLPENVDDLNSHIEEDEKEEEELQQTSELEVREGQMNVEFEEQS